MSTEMRRLLAALPSISVFVFSASLTYGQKAQNQFLKVWQPRQPIKAAFRPYDDGTGMVRIVKRRYPFYDPCVHGFQAKIQS